MDIAARQRESTASHRTHNRSLLRRAFSASWLHWYRLMPNPQQPTESPLPSPALKIPKITRDRPNYEQNTWYTAVITRKPTCNASSSIKNCSYGHACDLAQLVRQISFDNLTSYYIITYYYRPCIHHSWDVVCWRRGEIEFGIVIERNCLWIIGTEAKD